MAGRNGKGLAACVIAAIKFHCPAVHKHEVSLFTDFGKALSTIAIAAKVDTALIQAWGQTGVFATTVTDAGAIDVPFLASHPIVPFTHQAGDGYTHLGIVPWVYDNFSTGPTGAGATGAFIELQ